MWWPDLELVKPTQSSPSGRHTETLVPRPTSLSTARCPPCMRANPSHMNRPSPTPFKSFFAVSLAWKDAVLGCSLSEAIPKRCLRRIYHRQFTPAEARVSQHRTGNHLKGIAVRCPEFHGLLPVANLVKLAHMAATPESELPQCRVSAICNGISKPAPITLRVIGLLCNCGKIFGYSRNNDHRLGERKIVRDGQINLRGHPLRDERCQPRPGATRQGHCRFS